MPSDQELMAQIAALAGQINRHKNGQTAQANTLAPPGAPYPPPHYNQSWAPARGGYRGRGAYRGGRGGRGGGVHRNRTLVLNNAGASSDNNISGDSGGASTPQNPAWIVKTDRHRQLINPAIYEQQAADRAKAMEETRLARLKHREEKESRRLNRYIASNSAPRNPTMPAPSNPIIYVDGIPFQVMKDGKKLQRLKGDETAAKMTPKTTMIANVQFFRSKHGNLYKKSVVKGIQRYGPTRARQLHAQGARLTRSDTSNAGVKKIDEPCKIFSTTGVCPKIDRCGYIHDEDKLAVCKDFLLRGDCTAGGECNLSHDLTAERTPACLHFAKGNCSKENCRYSHVRVSPSAKVCSPFAIYGYCDKGASCTERHVHECPDFSNTGVCNAKGCKLPHKLKASTLRKNALKKEEGEEEESSDLSSDDDADEIGSDDVDSDDLEFLGGDNGEMDAEIPQQSDFVHL